MVRLSGYNLHDCPTKQLLFRFVGSSCAVYTCCGAWSGVILVLLVGGFKGGHCGCLGKLPVLIGIAELDHMVDVLGIVEEGLSCAAIVEGHSRSGRP